MNLYLDRQMNDGGFFCMLRVLWMDYIYVFLIDHFCFHDKLIGIQIYYDMAMEYLYIFNLLIIFQCLCSHFNFKKMFGK